MKVDLRTVEGRLADFMFKDFRTCKLTQTKCKDGDCRYCNVPLLDWDNRVD